MMALPPWVGVPNLLVDLVGKMYRSCQQQKSLSLSIIYYLVGVQFITSLHSNFNSCNQRQCNWKY